MTDYRLFGGVLRLDLEIPELRRIVRATPSWVLHEVIGPVSGDHGEPLGTDVVHGEVHVRLYRRPSGLRLVFDDTGCFDIAADGRTIHWYHDSYVSISDARADLTSRVLAAALHAAGTLCLHGSAVVFEDQAIGVIAPKYHGKSTLALALVAAGARLLTDDTLPVEPGSPAMARPGLHATRLWADSAARVGLGNAKPVKEGEKQLYSDLPDEFVSYDPCPLAALYLLTPVRDGQNGQVAWRTQLSTMESALLMIAHAKLAPLLGRSESAVLFQRATRLAQQVPVYRLYVVRDLDRVGDVAAMVHSWHTRETAALSSGAAGGTGMTAA